MNIVVDLEHTISNANHRISMKKNGIQKGIFQREFKNDRPNEDVIMFINQLYQAGHYILILSNKHDKFYEVVEKWLSLHEVNYNELVLSPGMDTHAATFKEQYIRNCGLKFSFALDDVGQNCAMFARNNIPCLRIVQK